MKKTAAPGHSLTYSKPIIGNALINLVMMTSYDYRLVVLSIFISILASYAALDLAGRATAARGRVRLAWLAGGACAMGMGIWSMHYIRMLAFGLPHLRRLRLADRGSFPPLRYFCLRRGAVRGEPPAHESAARRTRQRRNGQRDRGHALHRHGCHAAPSRVQLFPHSGERINWPGHRDFAGGVVLSFTLREGKGNLGWKKKASAVLMGAAIPVMQIKDTQPIKSIGFAVPAL
jgi:Bacterial signalling protein N terminal repeat